MNRNRWTPYRFANGKRTRNRVVVPPMASQTADPNGFVTPLTLTHYDRLARSQAGMIFVEYSYVHSSGKSEPHQLGVSRNDHVSGLRELALVIQKSGALAGLQIVHAGGKSSSKWTGQPLIGPSAVAVPVKDWNPETPRALSRDEVPTFIRWHVEAAERAQRAGFDFVQIHAAHGYGLNQWLSPLTNRRSDENGGSLEGRERLLLEIVRSIKNEMPDLLLSVRIPGQDHHTGGLTVPEMSSVVAKLESAGADLIDVSSGIGGWKRPEGRRGEGYLVEDATQIKRATNRPVVGVGGLQRGPTIDRLLAEEQIDFAAVGRAILQDPQAWHSEHLAQNPSDGSELEFHHWS